MARDPILLRLRLLRGGFVFGPGKAELLGQIAETGSIAAAARAMGMSYKKAWRLVDEMNRGFKTPLVDTTAGGPEGGGAHLTEAGREALAVYRKIETKAAAAIADDLRQLRLVMTGYPDAD